MVTSYVRRRYDPLTLGQFREHFGSALKRHAVITGGIKRDYRKHLVADTKEQIVFPLHILGYVRQRQAKLANGFGVHRFTK